MNQLTHIGLDVHKDTIAVAVLRPDTVVCDERVIPNTPEAVHRLLSRYPDPSQLSTCYEAGPTAFIARQVRRHSDAEHSPLRSLRPPNDTIPATTPTPRGSTWVEGASHCHLGARVGAAADESSLPHHPSLTWKRDRVESIHRSWNQGWGLGEAAAARAAHSASRPGDRGFQAVEPTWPPGRFRTSGGTWARVRRVGQGAERL